MARTEGSIASLLNHLIDQVGKLIRQEIRLAKAEVAEKAREAQAGIGLIIAGIFFAFCALLTFLFAAVAGLMLVVPAWAAALIVGGVALLLALILISSGKARLDPGNLVPERAVGVLTSAQDDRHFSTEPGPRTTAAPEAAAAARAQNRGENI